VTADTAGILDEAYQRLHRTGPEFDGRLSNHGPMAAEAMARHGQFADTAADVHARTGNAAALAAALHAANLIPVPREA
jgi:hypothetical protein